MIYLILCVCIITPLANDIYVSSLPEIGHLFNTTKVSLVASVFLLAFSLSQLIYGPLSDRFGRKPVLLLGLTIYSIGSLVILLSHTFDVLLVGRVIQAIGACSTISTAMAIAKDTFPPEKVIHVISLIFGIIGACVMFGPGIGSLFQYYIGYKGPFGILFALGIAYILIISFLFKESIHQKNIQATNIKSIFKNYGILIQNKPFLGYILTSFASYGILFSYIAASSVILINNFNTSVIFFGIAFSINGIAIAAVSILAPIISKYIKLSKMLFIGSLLLLTGVTLTFIISNIFHSPYALILPMWISILGCSFVRPTASSGAMHVSPKEITGTASAMFNFLSFLGGSLATYLISLYPITINRLLWLLLVLSVIAILSSRYCVKHS